MRSKRRQKRIKPPVPTGLPDPFGKNNRALVDREQQEQYEAEQACPCCIDRWAEIEQDREARGILAWAGKS
jgi:hypothetical protein